MLEPKFDGIEAVGDVRCNVGESPAWDARGNAWYWTDIPAKRVWRLDGSSGALRSWSTPEMVACLAVRENGGLIAGMETGVFNLRLAEDGIAQAEKLAAPAPEELTPEMRFNDGRCDRQGRFWAGTMFRDMGAARPDGRLYRYDSRGLSSPVVSGLVTQNGLAFSPDGRTMYLSDSHPTVRRVWAFDYDVDAGIPHNRRLFVDMADYAGRPDGAAIDADGCYWVVGNDGGCLLRFTPDGRLDRQLALPMAKPSMCSFGGAGLDTLLVTSIDPGNGNGGAMAGSVLLLRPGVSGVAETPFAAESASHPHPIFQQQATMTKPFKRILFTGAAGGLGRRLREHLQAFADVVRLSDLNDFGPAREGEEIVLGDLGKREDVFRMCEGVDAVVHFGGVSTEEEWAPIQNANIHGMVNLYEAVHTLGIRRVVFASSNHTVGMYKTTDLVDASMATRPDGYYGVSKVFGEALSRYYWDRFGIETVCIRIGYCFPEPSNHRQAVLWLSLEDLVEMLRRSLITPAVGHTIAFCTSDNPGAWWDNREARHLAYVPKDSAKVFTHLEEGRVDHSGIEDITLKFQGGVFLNNGPKYPKA